MVNDQVFLEQFGGVLNNSLHHLLNNNLAMNNENRADEPEIMQHSSYHDDHSLHNIFKDKSSCFSILSLNCQSLNAKFDQINIKVQQLKSKGYEFNAICLQETWLSDNSNTSLFHSEGYTSIHQGKICAAHAGLAIYISTKFKFKTINIYKNSQIWEVQFLEIIGANSNKSLILGNICRPPPSTNNIVQSFITELMPILEHLQSDNREVVIAGDYNIYVLKINDNAILGDYFN